MLSWGCRYGTYLPGVQILPQLLKLRKPQSARQVILVRGQGLINVKQSEILRVITPPPGPHR